eukprot:4788395-Pyramimonas_sp.AAC.1
MGSQILVSPLIVSPRALLTDGSPMHFSTTTVDDSTNETGIPQPTTYPPTQSANRAGNGGGVSMFCGGGRGKYRTVDGDFLGRFFNTSPLQDPPSGPAEPDHATQPPAPCADYRPLVVLHKNIRGLTCDDRFSELLLELATCEWDAILINETMRPANNEMFTVEGGHMYAGSGGGSYKHGVGILLHARWVHCFKQFVPVSSRIAYMDIRGNMLRMRFVTAYFPHRKYPDRTVQEVYDELSNIVKAGAREKLHIVMGADCNAQVGPASDTDNRRVCGKHAHGDGDARGQWLKQWANAHNL